MNAMSMVAPTTSGPGASRAAAEPASLRAALLKVDRLMDIAFFPGRAERSPEYQEGCRAALEFHLIGRRLPAPYVAGCAAADAFVAGVDEGHAIWRRQRVDYSRLPLGE
ncbi:hypothetical protein [Massilia soli]|uniref:Uncharacterized protein n=1 Tax=Massilia soli TaxID=2792854 RepID=A0ABS7SRD1_9BURK|nr:hypothetical protein [Massilia soli]MBZ2208504.1 hypothetical protein [Massilia soli]